jgi:hypothetical protein
MYYTRGVFGSVTLFLGGVVGMTNTTNRDHRVHSCLPDENVGMTWTGTWDSRGICDKVTKSTRNTGQITFSGLVTSTLRLNIRVEGERGTQILCVLKVTIFVLPTMLIWFWLQTYTTIQCVGDWGVVLFSKNESAYSFWPLLSETPRKIGWFSWNSVGIRRTW